MTTAEAIALLKEGIQQNDAARAIRDWYLDVEGARVSPKWAAKHLFKVSVRNFSADEARRALHALGLNCYHT